MKTLLIIIALLTAAVNPTHHTITCSAQVTANNEVTMYGDLPQYDGMIYDADTENYEIGQDVICIIDTKGTLSVYDDIVNLTEITLSDGNVYTWESGK